MTTCATIVTRWGLAVAATAVMAGPAFGDDQEVLLTGLLGEKRVVSIQSGVETPVGATAPDGTIPVRVDPTVNYVLYEGECMYYYVREGSTDDTRCRSDDPNATASGTSTSAGADTCRRCRREVGLIVKGKWLPDPAQRTEQQVAPEGGGRFRVGVYAFGSAKVTVITNANAARPVVQSRFDASNYNPDRTIDIDNSAQGPGFGGGVDVVWGGIVGARIGGAWESERNAPEQRILGERDLAGLRFNQEGESMMRSTMLFVGPTVRLPAGVVLTGGPTFSWWRTDLRQTGMLQAGCPNACRAVRSDDVSEESSGSDVGFHAGVEYYPGDGWLGLSALFSQVRYRNVYGPDRPLAWPTDWTDRNMFFGVTVRTTNVRTNRARR
jgi:hypothetical protein